MMISVDIFIKVRIELLRNERKWMNNFLAFVEDMNVEYDPKFDETVEHLSESLKTNWIKINELEALLNIIEDGK